MHFRCPACSTVHPLNAAVLAQGGGKVRCGKCNATANALDSLFDDWPGPGQKPAARGELPVLGQAIDLQAGQRAQRRKLRAGKGPERVERGDVEAVADQDGKLRMTNIGGDATNLLLVSAGKGES